MATLSAPVDDDLSTAPARSRCRARATPRRRAFDVVTHDLDLQSIFASTGSVAITEGVAGTAVSVHLNKKPAGQVTIGAVSNLPLLAAVGPASRTFDASNWNQGQSFTISAPVDDDTAGGMATITLSSAGVASVPITATVTDPDIQQILVTAPQPVRGRRGRLGQLQRPPPLPADRQRRRHRHPRPRGRQRLGRQRDPRRHQLADRRERQRAAVHDVDLADGATTVVLTSGGLTTNVPVTIDDPDVQTVIASVPSLTVVEGATATFNVKLDRKPANNTVVTITSATPAKLGVTPA